jgi:hypothetical protein
MNSGICDALSQTRKAVKLNHHGRGDCSRSRLKSGNRLKSRSRGVFRLRKGEGSQGVKMYF